MKAKELTDTESVLEWGLRGPLSGERTPTPADTETAARIAFAMRVLAIVERDAAYGLSAIGTERELRRLAGRCVLAEAKEEKP